MKKQNIIVVLTDQQRFDSLGCNGQTLDVTPNIDKFAEEGVNFKKAYTVQPVCGPARAVLQTGLYATQTGCYKNSVSLPRDINTLAKRMKKAGYNVAYVGKWHLATDRLINVYETKAVPLERRGGYDDYWLAADLLGYTSHGYDGYVFDKDGNKVEFKGYRADCITDFALQYLDTQDNEKPFFLFLSIFEPHHQNDHDCFEGPYGSGEKYKHFTPPPELNQGEGDWEMQYANYLGCCNAIDYNFGRIVDKLKEKQIYEDTTIIYTTDHGCHFKTKRGDAVSPGMDDHKRNCFENTIQIPMIIKGKGFPQGKTTERLVSLLDIPKTIVTVAKGDTSGMLGDNIQNIFTADNWKEEIFIQISESFVGRAIRTKRYTYCVYSPDKNPWQESKSDIYVERYLFDNEKDPLQKNNLINDNKYKEVKDELKKILLKYIFDIENEKPKIK